MSTTQTKKGNGQAEGLFARIRHLEGCPEARLESYVGEGPRKNQAGAIIGTRQVLVARCVDCGEQVHENIIESQED